MSRPMADRPTSLSLAALLLLIIGLPGVGVGVTIAQAMSAAAAPSAGLQIGLGIAGYGLLATISGIGLLRRRRAFWWLALATIGAGLVFQIALISIASLDPMFATGIVVCGVTLACLLAPDTRAALGRSP
jgi:hypothetical protein